jgi:integrase
MATSTRVESSKTPKLVKTGTPGIYKRGNRYVVVYRDRSGKQRKKFALTLAEARVVKAAAAADRARGEFVPISRMTVGEYYEEWLPSYRGRTRSGIRDETKLNYANQMRLHILPAVGKKQLTEVGPRDVKRLASDLRAKGLGENSVRLAFVPFKAMLATAFEDELIRRNPAAGVSLVGDVTQKEIRAKALSESELLALLNALPAEWRLFAELLAVSGLRISELLALQWKHVDFHRGRLLVRRRWFRGSYAPPKSRYGRRDIPLTPLMIERLARQHEDCLDDDALVFESSRGASVDYRTARHVFHAAAIRAGVPWATFHTLRHTCATMLFARGLNAKQVQAWLGHHAASFTLDTYVHLLPDDLADAPEAFDAFGSDLPPMGQRGGQHDRARQAEIPIELTNQ